MRIKNLCLLASVSFVALLLQAGLTSSGALAQSSAALTGTVSSTEEGNMEGVIVSANKEGSNITVSVVSDDKGNFSFPADRLSPGTYTISIRASGYSLVGPKEATVNAGQTAKADVKLGRVRGRDILPMLSNAEWLNSLPGSDQQ